MLTRRALLPVLGVLAAAVVLAPGSSAAPSAQRATSSTVDVKDDFFAPTKLTVKQNTKIKFKWDGMNTDSHNVTLQSGPKGVKTGCPTRGKNAYSPLISKCNKSTTGAIGIKFTKKFDKPGTYKFNCTIHPTTMNITIKVKPKRRRN